MKTRSITPINNNRAFYYAYYISDRGGQSVIVTRSWPRFLLLRRILETIRFYLTFAVQLCAFPHNPRGSKWIEMILFSFIFPVSFLTRSHRDVVKSRSESVLRFNFTLCFDVNANGLRKYMNIQAWDIYTYIEIEMNFIQFPDPMYPYTMYFSRMRYISRVNEPRHEEIELDWTLRFGMCSLRLVTDHEDTRQTIKKKMHEQAFSN